jgi:hypothetical protein
MRNHRFLATTTLALLALTAGTGCMLFPQLKDKVVDLVTSGSVTAGFQARGSTDVYSETKTIDIRDSLDVAQVLDDAGIDVADVKSITLGGVSYRITKAQAGRTITDGTITVQRSGGAEADLVGSFTADAGAVTGWITPTLTAAGVTQLNDLLADVLAELQGGAPANEVITYSVSGTSNPTGTDTDFDYQLRLTISIVGKVKTKWLE